MGRVYYFYVFCFISILVSSHAFSNQQQNPFTPASNRAQGDMVVVNFTADIISYNDFTGWLHVDTSTVMRGSYVYTTGAVDQDPDPRKGDYFYSGVPCGMTITVWSHVFRSDPSNVDFTIRVRDSTSSANVDTYYAIDNNPIDVSWGTPVLNVYWYLTDSTGTALSNDLLPSVPPDLSDWQDLREVFISGDTYWIKGRITSVTEGVIPALGRKGLMILIALLSGIGALYLRARLL